MTTGHKESDLEALIETHLVEHGWAKGNPLDFDPEMALIQKDLFALTGSVASPRLPRRFWECPT